MYRPYIEAEVTSNFYTNQMIAKLGIFSEICEKMSDLSNWKPLFSKFTVLIYIFHFQKLFYAIRQGWT